MAEYKSKSVVVNIPQMELFQRATDLQGILLSVPEEQRKDIKVDGDTLSVTYAGFPLVVRISEKVPFSKVVYQDVEAPFHFTVTIHFEPASVITRTTLSIVVDAELNFMMKAVLGGKIQECLDKAVMSIASGGIIA